MALLLYHSGKQDGRPDDMAQIGAINRGSDKAFAVERTTIEYNFPSMAD
jgi:hypothetical protein